MGWGRGVDAPAAPLEQLAMLHPLPFYCSNSTRESEYSAVHQEGWAVCLSRKLAGGANKATSEQRKPHSEVLVLVVRETL